MVPPILDSFHGGSKEDEWRRPESARLNVFGHRGGDLLLSSQTPVKEESMSIEEEE